MDINNHDYLNYLFELTLFGIFVYYFIGIISKHVLPFLREQIIAWQSYIQDLSRKKSLLSAQREALEKQVRSQRSHFVELEEKIRKWHAALIEQQKEKESSFLAITKKIELKRKTQTEKSILILMQREVFPHAINECRQELMSVYSDTSGKKHLTDVIKNLHTS